VELLDDTLTEIIMQKKCPVIMVSGNHDSPVRIGFAGRILRENGLYIAGEVSADIKPIVFNDEHGEVHIYTIPFAEHAAVREAYADDSIKSQSGAIQKIMEAIYEKMDKSARNVCIAHSYIGSMQGMEESDSERQISVGGTEIVDAAYFDQFCYTALGHLHKAQKALKDNIRYSGSLLKYSFSESRHVKSVTIAEIDSDGNASIEQIPIEPLHDMREIKGKLKDLISEKVYQLADTNDYIKAILTDEGELIEPMYALRSVYPNILRMERQKNAQAEDTGIASAGEYAKKPPLEIAGEFYEDVTGEKIGKSRKAIIESVLTDIMKGERL